MIKILITPQGFELFDSTLYILFGDNYDVEFTGGMISD